MTARLNSMPGGCKQALKSQLSQVDTQELTVEKVHPHGSTSASAEVKSTYAGKTKVTHAHACQGKRRLEDLEAGLSQLRARPYWRS